ncbi:MAG: HD-GYP domain-containing protein [Thermoanaerobaculia bacterium]
MPPLLKGTGANRTSRADVRSGPGSSRGADSTPDQADSIPDVASGEISLSLTEVAIALSDALNLVGFEDAGHGKRVAFIATEVGKAAGFSPEALELLFLSALLHDCGVSSNRVFRMLTENFEWEETAEHCLAGHRLLFGFPPFRSAASVVLHHHDRWDSTARRETESGIALLANAIFLADRSDVLCLTRKPADILMARGSVRDGIAQRSNSHFAPELVGAFLEASLSEAFWLMLEERHIDRYVEDELQSSRHGKTDSGSLRQLAAIFAQIVDAKSPFTAQHSEGVARLTRVLGGLQGMSKDVCDQLEIAGLLHDLGKLRVPDEILDKPGPLDAGEASTISRHSFETYQILRRLRPFRTLAIWASFHHESLSGRGYPFNKRGPQIPVQARTLAVADVFQALLQRRPYRRPISSEVALGMLREMANGGKLDGEIVEILARNLDLCRAAAVGDAPDQASGDPNRR